MNTPTQIGDALVQGQQIETDLKEWMEARLATKVEVAELRLALRQLRENLIAWIFIFWVAQVVTTMAMMKFLK